MSIEPIISKLAESLAGCFGDQRAISLPAMPAAARALSALALHKAFSQTVVWITDGPKSLEIAHRDILTLSGDPDAILYYPAGEVFSGTETKCDPDILGYRLSSLLALHARRQRTDDRGQTIDYRTRNTKDTPSVINHLSSAHLAPIIVTCVQALMQNIISPEELKDQTFNLRNKDEIEIEVFIKKLETSGYNITAEVVEKVQAAARGGIVDIWPPTEAWPVRIEFFGPVVESIRSFDPASQRSIAELDHITIPPLNHTPFTIHHPPSAGLACGQPALLREALLAGETTAGKSLLDYLPSASIFMWSDPDMINEHAIQYENSIRQPVGGKGDIIPLETLKSLFSKKKETREVFQGENDSRQQQNIFPSFQIIEGVFDIRRELIEPDVTEAKRRNLIADLCARSDKGWDVTVYFDTPGALEHFRSNLKSSFGNHHSAIQNLQLGSLSEGFICEDLKLIIAAESDLYGRKKISRRRYSPLSEKSIPGFSSEHIAEFTDIEPGDLIVHSEHGLGRYLGLFEIKFNGRLQEVFTIEYAGRTKLHVPVSEAHLISRYAGISSSKPSLNRIGGSRWKKDKTAAVNSIAHLAASLLKTQAERNVLDGHAFPKDEHWQYEFENSFPYHETPDQHKAIIEVKRDMESSQAMDRLVCGDAGYGKTEIAMRAAFKAVMDEKQVAVLVPTTVLAQQHYETFAERMSPYPVRVEMLSRFCPGNKRANIIKGLADGTIDIVIGTHALLQPGIRFKDLGLVVVDEEQRFGVEHKERLKRITKLVDVLTLTATPIPRTLYMSMTGAREMSLIQSPPSERTSIETIVTKYDEIIVREAILREINRGGQVFYLYNRVMTIDKVRERLEKIVPEVKIEIAHGRMPSSQLASVMQRFVAGESDVLLCTTIIENGMDIPKANTILIDRADRFGISDLYQLRGRVGRSSHKAYAYLLIPSHGHIDSTARNRISAVKQYSALSTGFSLALRDLEIRGAGNLLGSEQSGHINAIGFGLYCQLLKNTIAQLKNQSLPPVITAEVHFDFLGLSPAAATDTNSAIIPYKYIDDERLRVKTYRKLAEAISINDVSELRNELKDRFGPVPPSVERLLKVAELKITASLKGISLVGTREGKVIMRRNNDYIMENGRFPKLYGSLPDEQLEAVRNIIEAV